MNQHSRFNDDLSRKMFDTLDLKSNPTKANLSFQKPMNKMGKRPQNVSHQTSNKAANWSHLNLDDNEFIAQPQMQSNIQAQSYGNSGIIPQQTNVFPPSSSTLYQPPTQQQNQMYNQSAQNIQWNSQTNFMTNNIPTQSSITDDDFGDFIENASGTAGATVLPPSYISAPTVQFQEQNTFSHMQPLASQHIQPQTFMTNMNPTNFTSNLSATNNCGMPNTDSTFDDFGEFVEPPLPGPAPTLQNASMNKPLQRRDVPPPKIDNTSLRSKINSPPPTRTTTNIQKLHTPSWVSNPAEVPEIYRQILGLAGLPNGMVETSILYPILSSSGLPQPTLAQIWGIVNLKTPGQLTYSEMFVALALVSLAQNSITPWTWDKAISYTTPPIPRLVVPAKTITPQHTSDNKSSRMGSENDDFGDFQFVSEPQPTTLPSGNINLNRTVNPNHENSSSFLDSKLASNLSKPNEMTTQDRSFPISNFPKPVAKNPPSNLLDNNDDKYAVFRDLSTDNEPSLMSTSIFESAPSKAEVVNVNDDFSDFQGSDIISEPPPSNKTSDMNFGSFSDFSTADSLSMTSSSIGNNSTDILSKFDGVIPVSKPKHNNTATTVTDLFSTWDSTDINASKSFTNNIEPSPIVFPSNAVSTSDSTTESIFSSTVVSKHEPVVTKSTFPKPPQVKSPQRKKLPDVSKIRYFSENDDDFGDFAEPPPIEVGFHEDEFDTYNTGNSDLHDFDALDHFEEEKRQVTMSTKPRFATTVTATKTKQKEDQTAINFVTNLNDNHASQNTTNASQNQVDLAGESKTTADDWGSFSDAEDATPQEPSTLDLDTNKDTAGDEWGEFSDNDDDTTVNNTEPQIEDVNDDAKPNIDPKWTTSTHLSMNEMIDVSLSTITSNVKPSVNNTDIKTITQLENHKEKSTPAIHVEPSYDLNVGYKSVFGNNLETNDEIDSEAEELKARMQGQGTVDPLELYADHWSRCLVTCKEIITSANDIFAASKSPSVCKEVVNSKHGRDFISDISEVYGVSRRIRSSMDEVGLKDNDILFLIKEIDFAWHNLLGFCPYTPAVHKTPQHCTKDETTEDKKSENAKFCGLCLLDTTGNNEVDYPMSISYGDRGYHAACANLWLNQVAPILPRLELSIIQEIL